jgi:NitT/TauT family transport system ATP-binding protein
MNLGGQLDAYPGHLSGGQQRRVALARAFVNEPELLLLDEPFTSLDAPTAQQLRDLLLALWQRQRPTVLFVTHDLREALSLGDRILFLSAGPGRIVLDLPLELPRPRSPDGPAVEAARRRLLDLYPGLLRGLDKQKSAEDAA